MRSGIAAGHPATAEAGAEILDEGGNAADAGRRDCLRLVCRRDGDDRPARRRARDLLRRSHAERAEPRLLRRGPRAGTRAARGRAARAGGALRPELVHYAVGIGSCGVPGVPAGLDALWHGARPACPGRVSSSRRCGSPAAACRCRRRTRPACAMLEPVMTMNEGARDLLARRRAPRGGGPPPAAGARRRARGRSPRTGRAASTRGRSGARLLGLMEERGGLVTAEDLDDLRGPLGRDRSTSSSAGHAPHAARGSRTSRRARRACPSSAASTSPNGCSRSSARSSTTCPLGPGRRTSPSSTPTGNACVLTTSLGLGSGDFLPGLDLHLNSMLGEADLLIGDARARRADGRA